MTRPATRDVPTIGGARGDGGAAGCRASRELAIHRRQEDTDDLTGGEFRQRIGHHQLRGAVCQHNLPCLVLLEQAMGPYRIVPGTPRGTQRCGGQGRRVVYQDFQAPRED